MSPESKYPAYQQIVVRLRKTAEEWRSVAVVEGLLLSLSFLCGSLFILTLFAGHLPSRIRLVLALTFLAALAVVFFIQVMRPLFRPTTDSQVARHIEEAFPELNNALINAVQLAHDELVQRPNLVRRAIEESADTSAGTDFSKAISRRRLKECFLAAALTVLLLLGFALYAPDRFANALQRVLFPTRLIPALGKAKIVEVEPGSVTVLVSSSVTFRVLAEHDEEFRPDASISYQHEGSPTRSISLTRMGAERDLEGNLTGRIVYSAVYPEVLSSFSYQAKIGQTESNVFTVKAIEAPAVAKIDLVYDYPAYTGLSPAREENVSGEIETLYGTDVEFLIAANKPIERCSFLFEDGASLFLERAGQDDLFKTRLSVREPTTYRILLRDEEGNENDPLDHAIKVVHDQPPRVAIVKPGDGVSAAPGDLLKLVAKATDDYGVTGGALLAHVNDTPVDDAWREWQDLRGRTVAFEHNLRLDKDRFKTGDVITYHFLATDNLPDSSQEGKSPLFTIKVSDPEQDVQKKVGEYSDWEKMVAEILRRQEKCRADTAEMPEAKFFTDHLASVREDQRDIRNLTIAAADKVAVEDDHTRLIKNALAGIAGKEMLSIVKEMAGLEVHAAEPERSRVPLVGILEKQDKIIMILKQILQIIPRLVERAKAVEEGDPAEDLPDDVISKLQELADKLKEFIEEQKKVIDQTKELAKQAVDDLTDDDLLTLEELAAIEDKWEKFLREAHSDFSMLPEQDFTNPSLLDELIEIYSEVEKAEDALTKKAMNIAVPVEQAGAELAEALTTHIEKWLPDTADRDRWSMEEPLEEYDTPMAELPDQLEDLIGELMEEEEDLFEEIEDVTSSWSDSLDKGAGWDAMDGPISNMSAQGVTGNRLPNSSEIGGRSGEGRTGKSHGEFVEKTATGKGGRRTPTRLTPDPFEAGEVQDTSQEPPGGATGGGKLSGGGSEGLEGPVPPHVQKKMQALQGKQATLRNKAEQIDLGFKVINYQASDLKLVIKEMRRIERDMDRGNYVNALRRKKVVIEGLRATNMFMGGEVYIRQDRTSSLPKELNEELLDARQNQDVPPGYEELLQNYFEAVVKESSSAGGS